ncbi:MAG: membrane dipeptidase [Candidatus Azotimanducaceae bacterium]|jgi:membrane dipeptidase
MHQPATLPFVRAFILILAAAAAPSYGATTSERIAQDSIIIDTHIDVPYRLFRKPADVSEATESGEFDYPRAKAGGLNAPFMSIYIPAATDEAGEAYSFANEAIDLVENLASSHPDKFAVATCAQDVVAQKDQGLISLPMGMENGGPMEGKLANARHFFERGIRYVTLAHSKSNHISDSSYDTNEAWQGLSPFGHTLVAEMNRLGIMVDISHVSDKAFWQVLALSQTPVIASHSSLRHFTPDFHRNMSDDMVQALAAKGGVIQINYGSSFLTHAARQYSNTRTAAVLSYATENDLKQGDAELTAFMADYSERSPFPFADLDDVLDHIDRAVEIAGIDAVGIGSDFDGVGDSLPSGLKDVASYPNLIKGLLKRGYSEPDVKKILGGNTLRVWRAIEAYARDQGTATQCRTAVDLAHPDNTVAPPVASEDEFHFVVLGDSQFHFPAQFNRTIDQVRTLRPAFVIQVGDLIQGYNSNLGEIEQEWQRFKAQVQPLSPVPYYPIPGNHDVYSGDKRPDKSLEDLFEKTFGPLYFSFRYKNSLFVGLNSESDNTGEISDEQIDWLADRLRETDAEHKFVFMHRPPLLMKKADRLHEIFKSHGVGQVIYGHHHHYHHLNHDGVNYTMTNAGGRMAQENKEIGGFFHMLQISVRGEEVDVAVINNDAIQGQDAAHPKDNYDVFALKRGLAAKSVKMEVSGEGSFEFNIPLTNTSERNISVYVDCSSEDNRWTFEPASIERVDLKNGKNRTLKLSARYDADRRPESDPLCTLTAPMQTVKGKWITLEHDVTGTWRPAAQP